MTSPRVCLLVPAASDGPAVPVPWDVLLAAARLRADGCDVTVWDERLAAFPPAASVPDLLVVFTAVGTSWPVDLSPVRAAVDRARAWFPGVRVLAVGPHGSRLPGSTLLELTADHVAVGEAASAAVRATRDLASGAAVPVLYGGMPRPLPPVLVVGNRPPPYRPLECWPPPAHDLVPLCRYTARTVVDGVPRLVPAGAARMADGPGRVLASLAAQRAAGLGHVVFLDRVFGADGDPGGWLRGRGVEWTSRTRADVVLRSDVRSWAAAGCRTVWLDAGPRTREAAARLSGAGITPCVSVLVGAPGGTRVPDPPAWFAPVRFVLRPGTAAYDRLAPGLGGGTAPVTWRGVQDVNLRYRQRHPADLDELERGLAALPRLLPTGCEVPC
ncbi:radical SAM protein [Streptomyces acidiscabies]|uniref:radical SAM protein n=1 Tax=Streptomyces acidiscabies TaxID=42234 RepID=UPI00076EF07D|nr:radical SAM protein [Streptomyces acidiscabies]GAQ51934.1 hypothetical protein a10_01715 [Streptomyces acidiscabies]